MEKNVVVIDEQGNKIGATFPKRAKGLVKNGRARFIDENTICLACPPNDILEDNKMNNNINEIVENYTAENEDTVETSIKQLAPSEIFEQIKKLQENITDPDTTIDNLTRTIPYLFDEEHQENEDRVKIVETLAESFNNREETTWKILNFYEKMYDDVSKLEKIKASTKLIHDTYVGMIAVTNDAELDADSKLAQNQAILEKMTSTIEKLIL